MRSPKPITPDTLLLLVVLVGFLSLPSRSLAQQPFSTDDADVTGKKKFHVQLANEFDILQRSAYPSLRQNTTVFELDYGLFAGVEIGVDGPLILISNSTVAPPKTVFGFGDLDFHVKYNFLKERPGSRLPALTLSVAVELPTGDTRRQLGSGLTDYFLNGIVQKSLTEKTKLRLNGGILFSGNTTTGDIGIRRRGNIFVGGVSLVKQITPKLDLGAEITGALSKSLELSNGQLQTLIGGNYALTDKMTFDFGIVGGRFAASPRAGLLLGISVDF